MHSCVYVISRDPVGADFDAEDFYNGEGFLRRVADYIGEKVPETEIRHFLQKMGTLGFRADIENRSFTITEETKQKYFEEKAEELHKLNWNGDFHAEGWKEILSDSSAFCSLMDFLEPWPGYSFYLCGCGFVTLDGFLRDFCEPGEPYYILYAYDFHY